MAKQVKQLCKPDDPDLITGTHIRSWVWLQASPNPALLQRGQKLRGQLVWSTQCNRDHSRNSASMKGKKRNHPCTLSFDLYKDTLHTCVTCTRIHMQNIDLERVKL